MTDQNCTSAEPPTPEPAQERRCRWCLNELGPAKRSNAQFCTPSCGWKYSSRRRYTGGESADGYGATLVAPRPCKHCGTTIDPGPRTWGRQPTQVCDDCETP
jgi:hypothetical protein